MATSSRPRLVCLIWTLVLVPALGWGAASETVVLTWPDVGGASPALCQIGTPDAPNEHGLVVQILDNPVYYTIHDPAAVPSASVGGLAVPGTIIRVDRASDFRAVPQGSPARLYLVCVPR
jgi:hypothetical protein